MTAKTDPARLDNAVALYLSGQTVMQVQSATGVSTSVLLRAIKARGIPARGPRKVVPDAEVVAAYLAGESEYALAQRYGVGRPVIERRLNEAGVARRSHSEAGLVRAAKMTAEERAAQAAAANEAARGMKQSLELLERRAITREQRGGYDSEGERHLAEWLMQRGLTVVPQKAIGKYNTDLAIHPIAVEVLGGGWHLEKGKHAVRTPEILNRGWHLVFVWDHEGDSALAEGAADYVVSYLDEVRRNPTSIGQYRVISGNGQPLAAGGLNDGEFALVPPPRGRKR